MMLVSELILDLRKKFPRSPIEAWEDGYKTALTQHEGDALKLMYVATMRSWDEPGPPKPAHFLSHAPTGDKPKSYPEILSAGDWKRLERTRERANALLATAREECAAFFGHEWSGIAERHLHDVCMRIADMGERGIELPAALARINSRENRPCYPRRAVDMWLDEHDAEIFRKRLESWRKVKSVRRMVSSGAMA